MGCWNHTCAISNLPVFYQDEVYVMLLMKQEKTDNNCYPHTYWKPLPFFFQGKYNDYGGVEECYGPMLEPLMKMLKTRILEMEEGENKYHDIPVKRELFDTKMLFDADHEHRLFFEGHRFSKEPTQITHIVIKKNVFEQLIERYKLSFYDSDQSKRVTQTYAQYREKVGNEIHKAFEKHKAEWNEIEHSEQKQLIERLLMESALEQVLSRYFDSELVRYNPLCNIKKLLVDSYCDNHMDVLNLLLDQLATLSIVSFFMSGSRAMWVPPSGAGSQNDSTSSQRLRANLILEEAEAIKKRFEE